jgi:hypothetical protein
MIGNKMNNKTSKRHYFATWVIILFFVLFLFALNQGVKLTRNFQERITLSETNSVLIPHLSVTPNLIPTSTTKSGHVTTLQPTIIAASATSSFPYVNSSNGVLVVHTVQDQHIGYILNRDGEVIKMFPDSYDYLSLSSQSCSFYGINYTNGDIQLDSLNINGEVLKSSIFPLEEKYRSPYLFGFQLSPDRSWIAFYSPSGDWEMAAEDAKKIDIIIINVTKESDTNNEIIRISSNSGGIKNGVSWSPDSQSLAYIDKDKNGIQQVFIYDIKLKSRKTVTHFDRSTDETIINEIEFSPEGKQIAYARTENHPIGDLSNPSGWWYEGEVGIINLNNFEIKRFNLPQSYFYNRSHLWWDEIGERIFFVIEGYDPKTKYQGQFLAWFYTKSGELIRTFPKLTEPGFQISFAFPLGDINRIGFSGTVNGVYDAISAAIIYPDWPVLCCGPVSFLRPMQSIIINDCK